MKQIRNTSIRENKLCLEHIKARQNSDDTISYTKTQIYQDIPNCHLDAREFDNVKQNLF